MSDPNCTQTFYPIEAHVADYMCDHGRLKKRFLADFQMYVIIRLLKQKPYYNRIEKFKGQQSLLSYMKHLL